MSATRNRRTARSLSAVVATCLVVGTMADTTLARAIRPEPTRATSWRRSPDGAGYEPHRHHASKAWFLLAAVGFAIVRKVRRG